MSSRPARERDRCENQPLVAVADEIQVVTALARGDNDALIGTPESCRRPYCDDCRPDPLGPASGRTLTLADDNPALPPTATDGFPQVWARGHRRLHRRFRYRHQQSALVNRHAP